MNVTEAYMRETRVGADAHLEKVAALGEAHANVASGGTPVHPHRTKAVAAENRRAFQSLLGA